MFYKSPYASPSHGLWRAGVLAAPLALAGLPLYVLLPEHYARQYGVPLASLGLLLLALRGADAITDPWIGRWLDRWFARGHAGVWRLGGVAVLLLWLGFATAFAAPVGKPAYQGAYRRDVAQTQSTATYYPVPQIQQPQLVCQDTQKQRTEYRQWPQCINKPWLDMIRE